MHILLFLIGLFTQGIVVALPERFVHLETIDHSIIQDVRYFGCENFIGRPIPGYHAPKCILTREAALALSKVQQALRPLHLGLKVYDCYRPQRAVNHFIDWHQDAADQRMKASYYPRVDKAEFFKRGYVTEKSGHSRGSTVDVTLVRFAQDGASPVDMDMGTSFDFMDEASHPLNTSVSGTARQNRLFLREFMQAAGFSAIETEWWHFTLKNEPFPNRYFDFPIQ
jgi:D-alanyl-D-alanine dipeptidase